MDQPVKEVTSHNFKNVDTNGYFDFDLYIWRVNFWCILTKPIHFLSVGG